MSEQRAASHAAAIEFLNPAQRRVHRGDTDLKRSNPRFAGSRGGWKRPPLSQPFAKLPAQRLHCRGLRPDRTRRSPAAPGAGISADTLQAYLAMGTREQAQTNRDDPANRRLFLIDESSLTSTSR